MDKSDQSFFLFSFTEQDTEQLMSYILSGSGHSNKKCKLYYPSLFIYRWVESIKWGSFIIQQDVFLKKITETRLIHAESKWNNTN